MEGEKTPPGTSTVDGGAIGLERRWLERTQSALEHEGEVGNIPLPSRMDSDSTRLVPSMPETPSSQDLPSLGGLSTPIPSSHGSSLTSNVQVPLVEGIPHTPISDSQVVSMVGNPTPNMPSLPLNYISNTPTSVAYGSVSSLGVSNITPPSDP